MGNRIALIVGIDEYEDERVPNLCGCVNDAREVCELLKFHGDAETSKNMECRIIEGTATKPASRQSVRNAVKKLFQTPGELALFYFSGHGYIDAVGGYIVASDCRSGDDGISLNDLVQFANGSPAEHRVIILDSCHSGIAGETPDDKAQVSIANGVTIMSACRKTEYALEENDAGVFTSLLINALEGAAASLSGKISPSAVYSHIDQSLGMWEQRPVFKTNTDRFVTLRKVRPAIPLNELRQICELFPEEDYEFELDPSYEPRDECREPEMLRADPLHNKVFSVLQKYNRFGLVVPIGAQHMWHAAMESKSCKLTRLGKHYRYLAARNLL